MRLRAISSGETGKDCAALSVRIWELEETLRTRDEQLQIRDRRIRELEERLSELERRLGLNSSNNSKPPVERWIEQAAGIFEAEREPRRTAQDRGPEGAQGNHAWPDGDTGRDPIS